MRKSDWSPSIVPTGDDQTFYFVEGWSQDVSADVAQELRHRCDLQQRDIPETLQSFTDRYEGRHRDVQLPLRLV